MPSGKVHDRITVIGAAVAIPVFFVAAPPAWRGDPWLCFTLVASTLFSGLMLSPDLDLDSSIYRRWGPLRAIWWPYQKILPHRSFFSHSLIIAPALRLAYFAFMLWAIFRIVTWGLSFAVPLDRGALSRQYADLFLSIYVQHPRHFWMLLIGTFLGTALHVGADVAVTTYKTRILSRRRRRRRH